MFLLVGSRAWKTFAEQKTFPHQQHSAVSERFDRRRCCYTVVKEDYEKNQAQLPVRYHLQCRWNSHRCR